MKTLLLILSLLVPGSVLAGGVLTPAANPPEPITVISSSGIPFIKAPSGTMGNNGAVSAMTALPKTYSGGAYLWLPAGAVAAGVPASATWYWFVASSTTAGTVYNSTYTSGVPRTGSLTAFSTTGPGAFTGDTGTVTSVSVTVPANAMGPNGRLEIQAANLQNGTGGNKVYNIRLSTLQCWNITLTTHTGTTQHCSVTNRGKTNVQSASYLYGHSSGSGGTAFATDGALDTTTDLTVTFTIATAVATDYSVLENHRVVVIRGD